MKDKVIYDYIIVGGGIAGLASLHKIVKKNKSVLCLEAEKVCGGFVKSWIENGYTLDFGPNVFLKTYEDTYNLVKDIGLEKDMVYNSQGASKRFICKNRTIMPVPENPAQLLKSKLLSSSSKLRLFMEPFIGRYKGVKNETIREFAKRRFGKEISSNLIDAVVSGICAGDIDKLEAGALFPKLLEIEKKHRSFLLYLMNYKKKNVEKGEKKEKGINFISFKKGMGEITARLYDLHKDYIKTDCRAQSLKREGDIFEIATSEEKYFARKLVLATPALEAGRLMKTLDKQLSDLLLKIPYSDMITLALGYEKESIKHKLDGFGFLVPRSEKIRLLGALFLSSLYPFRAPPGKTLLKVYVGGAHDKPAINERENIVLSQVLEELSLILNIRKEPDFCKLVRIKNAIPQYNIGHLEIKEKVRILLEKHNDIYLTGNYLNGVSVNEAVRSSNQIDYSFCYK